MTDSIGAMLADWMALGLRGIKLKLTLAIVLGVVATAVALTAVTNILVSLTFDLSLKERSEETGKILSQALASQNRQQRLRLEVLAQDPQFQQDFSFQAWDHLNESLERLRETTHCAAAIVLNSKGDEVAKAVDPGLHVPLLLRSTALAEAQRARKSASTIETIGGKTLLLTASPIIYYEQTVGYALVANSIDTKVLDQLKESSGAELLLVQGSKIIAGTCPLDGGDASLVGLEGRLASTTGIVSLDGLRSNQTPLLASAMPLRAGGTLQAALVFALSGKEAAAIRKRVTRAALGLALVITLLAGIGGLLIARRISDPIVEIEQSFREIAASGDLSRRITKSYSDEVGRMADSFNQMQKQIEALHERVVTAEQRMRSELQMASAVQEMLLPTTSVEGARCYFASHAQTSTETGGDWYTFVHSPEHHSTTTILADVTGHGAPAALVTAILHGFFRAVRPEIARAGEEQWEARITALLTTLNQTIIDSTRRSLVLSLILMEFDHRTLRARYLNAGHLAPLVFRTQAGKTQVSLLSLPPSSLVGDLDVPNFVTGQVQLEPDQGFLLYTDGLVECTNATEEQYGLKRLRAVLQRNGHLDARSLRDTVHSEVISFFGDVLPADDITFVVGRVR